MLADAAGFTTPREGVDYTALWFNASGLNRALIFRNKLTITGAISLTASEGFTQKNLHRSHAENVEAMRKQTQPTWKTASRCRASGRQNSVRLHYWRATGYRLKTIEYWPNIYMP